MALTFAIADFSRAIIPTRACFAPSSGTYSQIDITDVNSNVLASLSNTINADAAAILNNPAATVLSGFNTFPGSTGVDTLIGQGGSDQFFVPP
jgi:hypothetical protein